ncbi:hypothetical protein D3C75_1164720 [compost metagenome]
MLFIQIIVRVTQDQGIAFAVAAVFYRFDHFGKIGGLARGGEQTDRFGVIDLEAAGDGAG